MKFSFIAKLMAFATLSQICFAQSANTINPDPDATPLSPQESHKLVKVPEGFQVDLVAAEPMVNEPIAMAWGGDGALYVVELRGYMQDADHTGAQDPVGQVVRLVDTNGDGIMDKQSVFVDKLVEPRTIAAVKGGMLVGAPPDIFFCQDTTGDGVADVRKSIYDKFAKRTGNVEHKINGLMWGLDNYMYNAKSSEKFTYAPDDQGGKITSHRSVFRGQWGITQDSEGNIYSTGNTNPWYGEQFRLDYLEAAGLSNANFIKDLEMFEPNFKEVFPIVGTPDVQGGTGAIRPEDNTLKSFTAIGGQHIFRGDKLGEDMKESYWIPEPVGRLVRRAKFVEDSQGNRRLINPMKDQKVEFMASTDPNFRPVHAYTGPDGCLYIVDMYRGIIQDGNWVKPGSYLRREVERRDLQKNIQRGRIYRISKKGIKPGAVPKLDEFTTAQLVEALAHPNGWWRDEAQKRLVLAQDKSAVKSLKTMALNDSSHFGRLHAMWTLHGLGEWNADLAKQAIQDKHISVQVNAVRASEAFMQQDLAFIAEIAKLDNSNPKLAKQIVLSLGLCNSLKDIAQENREAASQLISKTILKHLDNRVLAVCTMTAMKGKEEFVLKNLLAQNPDPKHAKEWIISMTRMIMVSKNKKRALNYLDYILSTDKKYHAAMIHAMEKALPITRKGDIDFAQHDAYKFTNKPASVSKLEDLAKTNKAMDAFITEALYWFTWPGQPGYDKPRVAVLKGKEKKQFDKGKIIYDSLCYACHGKDGMGIIGTDGKSLLAPALVNNPRVKGHQNTLIKILLHGMTGPIDGKTYSGLMAPMGSNDDEWMSAITTYIRNAWGNGASAIPTRQIEKVRSSYGGRTKPWTQQELQ
ncbi:hypothetical protein LNTAR_11426 [Lentisphaera araneosa HTCC2155]|uniref:Cytochrome c domain-containing protein n=1 Tax=Lentisphaera araneosa HTCC2155 TaxID=313628 RepID=A6DJ88_9BACT|nr:c-type cytochrome [Lentisphaera araneosa]EDM28524.1 hypothetical protein LNTAR_11426 [Lentisphaera araneosa HTCC2155]